MEETYGFDALEIVDDYDHLDESLEYVLENVLGEEKQLEALTQEESDERQILQEQYNSVLINPCECHANATTDESCCGKGNECCHGGHYHRDAQSSTELVLCQEKSVDLIYECGKLCKCKLSNDKCCNRLVQIGPRKHLQIIFSKVYKSKGLITTVNIPKGAFICEYAGELLTRTEAHRRNALNARNQRMNYILCLNEIKIVAKGEEANEGRQVTFVDPSRRGNIGRYLNHSCSPNCSIYSVRVDCPIPKIVFSKRKILAGEELCFHYGGEEDRMFNALVEQKELKHDIAYTPCFCGAKNCEKFLPNIDFK